jgi:hypothetical protein
VRRNLRALANGTTNSCVKTVGNFRQVRRRAVCGTEILIPDRSGKIQSRLTQSLLRGMGLPEDEARRRTADRGQREGQGHERAKSPYRGLCPRNRKLRKPCSEAARSPHAARSTSHPVRPLPGAPPIAAASARRLADCAGRFHPARRASRISSMLTGAISPSGARKAGLDALADASDAHEARIARFSERLSAGSATTSRGWLNTVPG